MAKKQKSLGEVFTAGFIKENPVLRLVLGTCPTLAVTTMAFNGIGMGLAATAVLVGSNAVISLLRKVIPDKVRIPAFITIIAGFVTHYTDDRKSLCAGSGRVLWESICR